MAQHFPTSVILSTGRGWETHPHETRIEPALPPAERAGREFQLIDDARIPNRLVQIFSSTTSEFASQLPARTEPPVERRTRPWHLPDNKIATFLAYLPDSLSIKPFLIRQLIQSLAFAAEWIGFEVAGGPNEIAYQVSCREADAASVFSHLRNHLPEIEFRGSADKLSEIFPDSCINALVEVGIGLRKSWLLPIAGVRDAALDPTLPLLSAVDALFYGEALGLQMLISRTREDWAGRAFGELFDREGKPIFNELREHAGIIKQKLEEPLFSVCIRVVAKSSNRERSTDLARRMGAYFRQFAAAGRNELIPLTGSTIDPGSVLRSLTERTTFRYGMLLSGDEVSLIARFPGDRARAAKLLRAGRATKPAPSVATTGSIRLGENEHSGEIRTIRISPVHHGLVIGGTGSGKSTLLLNSILQNIRSAGGCCVVDPHGDLVDDVIARLPEDRLADTILFDPSDADHPIGFNVLQANSQTEKTFLASDMVATFRRYSSSWGDVMDAVLSNAVIAFVESSKGGTLFDLKRFLVEKEFRRGFLETVEDEAVRYFWTNEYPIISGRTQSSVLIRLDTFLRQKLVRNVVCQTGSRLNLREIVDKRKILLVKLSQGLLGEENAWLLGTLLISKIYGIALTRGDVGSEERPVWPVTIDEAAHFSGIPTMSLILENLRKFGISLTLSTQSHKLLMTKAPAVADSALTNCQVRICFRLGDSDAERMAGGFSSFDAKALQNLGTGEAIMRIEKAENDFNLRTYPAEPVTPETAKQRREAVVENTRRNYATPVKEVEAQFRSLRTAATTKVVTTVGADRQTLSAQLPDRDPPSMPGVNSSIPVRSRHSTEGRGGAHHKELQAVIKRMAETHGFRAEIEKSLAGGGWIDVSLETDLLRIACEVSVTTVDYEVTNIEKCLTAGYDYAIVVASNRKKLPVLSSKLHAALPIGYHGQIKAFDLADLLSFLRELSDQKKDDETVTRPDKPTGQRLNFAEACEMLNKSASTVYRWIREGRLPFYRIGRGYEFDRDELLLAGKHNLAGKRKALIKLEPLKIEKKEPKSKKEQDVRYRKLLKLD